jgi:hypothetical protein
VKLPTVKKLVLGLMPLVDLLLTPFVYPAAVLLKLIRRIGVQRMPSCRSALMRVGVFPIRDHYYEPLFNPRHLKTPLDKERSLTGVDWNVNCQLQLLSRFRFNGEMSGIRDYPGDPLSFHFGNKAFESGDAEYWYNLIRLVKPTRIFEVGSGNSTLMARRAIKANQNEDPSYRCKHVCIEPYEQPWLERAGVTVVRKRVQDVGRELFQELERGDILFIDSSHVIRPQGDVLFEYLELLPILRSGVIVHVHDIMTPRDYPREWIVDEVKFWNEQYLLEAFLTSNKDWRVLGALNYLHHNHYDALKSKCPYLTPDREPGSFYLEKL